MAMVIRLFPLDERGREIIDELEEKTEVRPRHPGSGARLSRGGRLYDLHANDVSVEWFDSMLNRIDSDWRAHVTRTSSILR
jgi:hypothetical protein